jgi:hypothetical protein
MTTTTTTTIGEAALYEALQFDYLSDFIELVDYFQKQAIELEGVEAELLELEQSINELDFFNCEDFQNVY